TPTEHAGQMPSMQRKFKPLDKPAVATRARLCAKAPSTCQTPPQAQNRRSCRLRGARAGPLPQIQPAAGRFAPCPLPASPVAFGERPAQTTPGTAHESSGAKEIAGVTEVLFCQ